MRLRMICLHANGFLFLFSLPTDIHIWGVLVLSVWQHMAKASVAKKITLMSSRSVSLASVCLFGCCFWWCISFGMWWSASDFWSSWHVLKSLLLYLPTGHITYNEAYFDIPIFLSLYLYPSSSQKWLGIGTWVNGETSLDSGLLPCLFAVKRLPKVTNGRTTTLMSWKLGIPFPSPFPRKAANQQCVSVLEDSGWEAWTCFLCSMLYSFPGHVNSLPWRYRL